MVKLMVILAIAILTVVFVPMVLADGTDTSGQPNVQVGNPNDPPVVYTDSTARSWYPNDQTVYTAEEYGDCYESNCYGDAYCEVSERGNYFFQGETITYYVVVEDPDGEDDIETVILMKDNVGVGSCAEIDVDTLPQPPPVPLPLDRGSINFSGDTMRLYKCKLIVQKAWTGVAEMSVKATDEHGLVGVSAWKDLVIFNPALSIQLQGNINFGTVEPGETAMSNSVFLKNVGSNGVVMDMYIASDDYFTDPNRPDAICGDGNGIPYYKFSYYATKGSLDSGDNDNDDSGLGVPFMELKSRVEIEGGEEGDTPYQCVSNPDEYTTLPSHSGEIEDMCRIINHRRDGSLLVQGQSMSLTFQLDVPDICEGNFNDGQFHFVGRVV